MSPSRRPRSPLPWPALPVLLLLACGGDPAPPGAPGSTGATEPPETAGAAAPLRFVAGAAGLDHVDVSGPTAAEGKRYLLDCIGPGLAVLDLDGDGLLDLFFPQGRGRGDGRDALYRNLGGRAFERVPGAAGADGDAYGFGALAFDMDADGDEDLLVTNLGENRLYRNDDGRLADVSTGQPDLVGPAEHWSTGAAAADPDRDGDLDVYLANYYLHDGPALDAQGPCRFMGCEVPCGPRGMQAQPDVYLRNDAGRFVDATDEAGLAALRDGYAFQPVFGDVDLDGDVDLYVTNDSMANLLFLNDGEGRFTEEGLVTGVSHGKYGNLEAGMGVALGDLDGDRLPELYVTNFSSQVNALYRNHSADGLVWFEEESHQAGTGYPTFFLLSWGCSFVDFDHDGLTDVYVANGHVYPQVDGCEPDDVVYRQTDSLFRQVQGEALAFHDLGAELDRVAPPASSRGSAAADLDGDGALDLVVTQLDEPALVLWNESPDRGHWLLVTVRTRNAPTAPWRHAVGARVEVTVGDRRWSREVRAGSSFLCTEDPRVHFGLGDATRADSLRVVFPDGTEQVHHDLELDRHLVLRQGEEPVTAGEAGG